ncbi:hypothetical protein CEXT_243731 [Caerostris extrusa]|uniref:Uncharacterized protein n=1 Tax=Caerostris extrusa TaxID=172846 RepID=A0AAV4VK07_CAEEX|nr:hypothetical protein CEXT_243731 [Caerostris extrusa]
MEPNGSDQQSFSWVWSKGGVILLINVMMEYYFNIQHRPWYQPIRKSYGREFPVNGTIQRFQLRSFCVRGGQGLRFHRCRFETGHINSVAKNFNIQEKDSKQISMYKIAGKCIRTGYRIGRKTRNTEEIKKALYLHNKWATSNIYTRLEQRLASDWRFIFEHVRCFTRNCMSD